MFHVILVCTVVMFIVDAAVIDCYNVVATVHIMATRRQLLT